jgi:hypothetical protein
MNPSEIDFNSLQFALTKTKSFLFSKYKNGSWSLPELKPSAEIIELDLFASCLNYGQACFEGLKVFATINHKGLINASYPRHSTSAMERLEYLDLILMLKDLVNLVGLYPCPKFLKKCLWMRWRWL